MVRPPKIRHAANGQRNWEFVGTQEIVDPIPLPKTPNGMVVSIGARFVAIFLSL